jgi:hypothetical protein
MGCSITANSFLNEIRITVQSREARSKIMIIGELYSVNHSRKGKFILKLTNESDEWITGLIVFGHADAIRQSNVKFEGEEITIRKSLCTCKEWKAC